MNNASKMATSLAPKLSKYAEQLSISDKRRYLEKVQDIGDPYIYELCTLQADFLPPVRVDLQTSTTTWCSLRVFVRVKGLRRTRAWTPTSILPVGLSAKLEEK